VDDGERATVKASGTTTARRVERRPRRRRGALEPLRHPPHAALEQLASNTEAVIPLELTALSSEHVEAVIECRQTGRGEEGGLAHPGPALHDDEPTLTARRVTTDDGQDLEVPVALEQRWCW
jgi:hypothetical protein